MLTVLEDKSYFSFLSLFLFFNFFLIQLLASVLYLLAIVNVFAFN